MSDKTTQLPGDDEPCNEACGPGCPNRTPANPFGHHPMSDKTSLRERLLARACEPDAQPYSGLMREAAAALARSEAQGDDVAFKASLFDGVQEDAKRRGYNGILDLLGALDLTTPPADRAPCQNCGSLIALGAHDAKGACGAPADRAPGEVGEDLVESVRRAIEDRIADMRCLGHTDWADLTNFLNAQFRRLAAVAPAGMDEVVAYLAESDREAYVFHANDGESLDAYTADGFTVTSLVRSTRAQPDSVMPTEVVQQQASLYNPATQVFFRAGLIACREYMARFVQAESPNIAASIRANWWPNLGQDLGPPRKIDWNELTEGEFGTASFRVKSAGEVSSTLEALPIALGFLELSAPTQPATAGEE